MKIEHIKEAYKLQQEVDTIDYLKTSELSIMIGGTGSSGGTICHVHNVSERIWMSKEESTMLNALIAKILDKRLKKNLTAIKKL